MGLGHDNIEHQPDRINWFEVDTRDWDTLELLPGWKDHNLTEVEVNRLWFQSGCTEKKYENGTECYKKNKTIRFDRPVDLTKATCCGGLSDFNGALQHEKCDKKVTWTIVHKYYEFDQIQALPHEFDEEHSQ